MAANPQVIPNAGPGTLFVFLHGMICLVETPDEFLGLVVDMGADHSYRMGEWLTEVPIGRGIEFRLQGVTAGAAALDDTKVSVIDKPLVPEPRVFATLHFPRPKAIRSLRRTEIPTSNVTGTGLAAVSKPMRNTLVIAALQVLEYDFAEQMAVAMTPSRWVPTPFNRQATLHFYAEPESEKPTAHQLEEFRRTADMFADLDLSTNQTFTTAPLENVEYPAGIPIAEAMGLLERQTILRGLALSFKEATPGVLPAPVVTGGDVLCAPLAARVRGK